MFASVTVPNRQKPPSGILEKDPILTCVPRSRDIAAMVSVDQRAPKKIDIFLRINLHEDDRNTRRKAQQLFG